MHYVKIEGVSKLCNLQFTQKREKQMRSVIIFIHFYNTFLINLKLKVVTGSNLNSPLKLLYYSLIITSNNFPPKVVMKILY